MQNKHNGMRAVLFTLALVLVFAAFAGCSAKLNDPVVGKVGNIDIRFQTYYRVYVNNMYMQSIYGTYDVSTDEAYRAFQDMVFDSIINSMLPIYVAKQAGVTLTAEEEAEVQESLQQEIDSLYESYADDVDASITDEDAKRAEEEKLLLADLKANGLTYDKYIKSIEDSLRDEAIANKYIESLLAEVTVTDDDVQAYYDEKLAYYQERYEEDPANYFDDYSSFLNGGSQPLVVPEGYNYYKHILVLDAEEGEDKDVDAIVAEIYAKIEAGEDFDALIEEYGEDPGMQNEPYKTEGYILSEANASDYYEEFSAAALALENEGDITPEAVQSSKGKHIIKKCGPVEAKTVTLDEVKDTIREQVETERKNDLYQEYLAQWKEEVKIVKYYNRVNGVK
ncbi:MAG: peptidylprolyl isomerase [Christensenellales bacterium]